MKVKLYAVRDLKAELFNTPVKFENDATAIRSFGDLVTSKDASLISQHPADFALCFVGEFDVEKGVITPAPNGFVQLAIGSDYLNKGE